MRARNIKPGFFKNEILAECSPMARLLYIGLWCMADREGRLELRPKRIKAELFPYENCKIESLLEELRKGGFIIAYKISDVLYLTIPTFPQHQSPHIKEAESTIPAPYESDACTILAHLNPESLLLNPEPITPLPQPGVKSGLNGKGFDAFWKAYPKKKSKGDAEKAWKKLNPNEQLLATMLARIEQAKTSEQWMKDGGQFIPYPATWLNKKGWEDEDVTLEEKPIDYLEGFRD